MVREMKEKTKIIISIIITFLVTSVLSVTATVYFNSENITFNPTNTNWKVTNTKEALNDLYTTMHSGNATAENILLGKTALTNNGFLTGTMPNNGVLNWTPENGTTFNLPAGYYKGGVLDSRNAFNNGKASITSMKLLWNPLYESVGVKSFSQTYSFKESYSYVIIVYFTERYKDTTVSAQNMTWVFDSNVGLLHQGVTISVFKNASSNAKVTYSFNNLERAGIAVYGIK